MLNPSVGTKIKFYDCYKMKWRIGTIIEGLNEEYWCKVQLCNGTIMDVYVHDIYSPVGKARLNERGHNLYPEIPIGTKITMLESDPNYPLRALIPVKYQHPLHEDRIIIFYETEIDRLEEI